MPNPIIEHIKKGVTTYDIKDHENEQRFSNGVLKESNGGTGKNSAAALKGMIVDMIFPIGSIYMTTNPSFNPETTFGGTWQQIKDRFLLAAGNTYSSGTGGAASVSYTPAGSVGSHTLTTTEIPSHSHSIGSHTHGFTPYGTASGTGSHSHSISDSGHMHALLTDASTRLINIVCGNGSEGLVSDSYWLMAGSEYVKTTTTAPASGKHAQLYSGLATAGVSTLAAGSAPGFSGTAGNTGTPSASPTEVAGGGGGHTHTFSGTAATIATMPPYQVVYVWERVPTVIDIG